MIDFGYRPVMEREAMDGWVVVRFVCINYCLHGHTLYIRLLRLQQCFGHFDAGFSLGLAGSQPCLRFRRKRPEEHLIAVHREGSNPLISLLALQNTTIWIKRFCDWNGGR